MDNLWFYLLSTSWLRLENNPAYGAFPYLHLATGRPSELETAVEVKIFKHA